MCFWTDATWCSAELYLAWMGPNLCWALSCSLMTVLVITPGSLPSCLADLTSPMPLIYTPCASVLACLSLCTWPRLDFEGLENGEDGFLDKAKSWSRSIEDLHHTGTHPFCNTLVRSARQSVLRYVWLSQLPRYYLSLLLPRSANRECYEHLVLFRFRIWPEWLMCYGSADLSLDLNMLYWRQKLKSLTFCTMRLSLLAVLPLLSRCPLALSSDESQLWAAAFVGQLWF